MKDLLKIGSFVQFQLDNNVFHKGSGIVQTIEEKSVTVKLDSPCKEFGAGTVIIVDNDELYVIHTEN